MRKIRKPKVPSYATMRRRVLKDNPWGLGESLATMLHQVWLVVRGDPDEDRNDFAHRMSRCPVFKTWCDEHHLAPYHVAYTLF